MWEMFCGFILGMVEGLTEFAPVSSTGHMILVGDLLGFKGQIASTFEVVVQLGSITAVVFVFRKRILNILNLPEQWKLIRDQWHGVKRDREPRLNLLHIFVVWSLQ
jgi:undecaprenyl-diphosphatase